MTRTDTVRTHGGWDRARFGILSAYLFNGFALAAWSVRLPGVQTDLSLTATEIGYFLTAGALGTLVTIAVAGAIVARWGAGRGYQLATIGFAAAYLLLGIALLTQWYPMLVIGGVMHGAAFALTNIPQSILSAASERSAGKTILPQFHAGYSIGAALGAAAGGLTAAAGVAPAAVFFALAVLAVLVRTVVSMLVARLDRTLVDAHAEAALVDAEVLTNTAGIPLPPPRWRKRLGMDVWTDGQVLAIGVLIVATALAESSANNWSSIALVEAFDTGEAAASVALTVFLIAQTVLRLAGGWVIDRIGRVTTLRLSFTVTTVGLAAFVFSPWIAGAYVGAAMWGAGAALVVPISIALAADHPRQGPARVTAVTSLSSLASIAGPPVIGVLAGLTGVRSALVAVIAAAVAAVLFCRRASTRSRS